MSQKDYYETLGVNKENSIDEIKTAYKKLALKFHPDRAPEEKKKEYEEKFKEMSEAYTILSNPAKRKRYDQFGDDSTHQGYSQEDIFRNPDISSIFEELFRRSNGGSSSRRKQRKGNDLQYNLIINFEESVTGINKNLNFKKYIICNSCDGIGAKDKELEKCNKCNGKGTREYISRTIFGIINQTAACEDCSGTGKIPKIKCDICYGKGIIRENVKVTVKIPAGVNTGNALFVEGKGDEIKNGIPGDLQVVIKVIPSKLFYREDDDIHMAHYISFYQAVMGDKINIPTPYGDTKIKISSGFESGTVMRIRDKGMENVNGYGKGNLYVKINIKTPTNINRKQRKLLKEWQKLE